MIITNLELTQSTLEIFSGCVCLLIAVIIMMNHHNSQSMKLFIRLFCTSAGLFFADAAAYIFRGNTDSFCVSMNRISNFIVFMLNFVLANLFVKYIYCLLKERGATPSSIYQRIADAAFGFAMIILVANIFTDWMYYFDDLNYYHRNTLWYVYSATSLICIIAGGFMAIQNAKKIHKLTLISILLFAFSPIIAVIIQSFIYGLSITNLGIAVNVILMLVTYLIRWKRSDYLEPENDNKRRRLLQMITLFVIMSITMSASIISCVVSINRISEENSEADGRTISHMIYDNIENEFLIPTTVVDTISNDYEMRKYLKESGTISPEKVENEMANFLSSIKDNFGYQMIYAVCDDSKAYYTAYGIVKYIDIENDPTDKWYKDFASSDKKTDFNIDTDEANNWKLSVFIHSKVKDEHHSYLGTFGIGIEITTIQNTIRKFEKEYGVSILLVDRDGLIQVSSDSQQIQKESVDNSYFSKTTSSDFYYQKLEHSNRYTKYLGSPEWYIVIEDNSPDKINVIEITMPSIIIFIAGLFMMAVAFGIITIREAKISSALIEKKYASSTDELTGLANRRSFMEALTDIEKNNKTHQITYIMIDLNGLKRVNDTLGHNAGDEYIIGASQCMIPPFIKIGNVYRIGGDEFVVLLNCTDNKVSDAIDTFNHLVDNWQGKQVDNLSVAIGVVKGSEHPELSSNELLQLADKLMYEDKEKYYEKNGKYRSYN